MPLGPRSRPLRVLITADAVGGVWTHMHTLVRALEPTVEFTVAVLGPTAPPAGRGTWRSGLHYHPCRLEWMDEPWADVRTSGAWLQRLSRVVRPDVVHINGYAHAALGFDAPVLVGAHSCVCSWWRAVHRRPAPGSWDAYRRAACRGLHAAALVVAPSAAMLRMLEAEHGPLPRRVAIHNGGTPAHRSVPKEPVIVSVGRFWDEAKNLRVLDAIAPGLAWPVVLLGPTDGPAGPVNPPTGVDALGPQRPAIVRHWLRRASIYAHPARYEPFGLAVLEAAQAGCALVLSDLPSLREVWGSAATYVPADDEDAWRHAFRAITADPARVSASGAAARAAARRYTAQRMARSYARLYEQLVGHDTHGRASLAPMWEETLYGAAP